MSCYDNGYSGIVIHKLDLIIHPSNGIHVQVTTRTSIMQPVFIPKWIRSQRAVCSAVSAPGAEFGRSLFRARSALTNAYFLVFADFIDHSFPGWIGEPRGAGNFWSFSGYIGSSCRHTYSWVLEKLAAKTPRKVCWRAEESTWPNHQEGINLIPRPSRRWRTNRFPFSLVTS